MRICPICESRLSEPIVRDLCVCPCCGLRRRREIPTVEELKERTKGFQLSATKRKQTRQDRLENARHQMTLLGLPPGRVYDVGAAAGFFLKVAKDQGWQLGGNELSLAAIEWARSRYAIDLDYGILEHVARDESFQGAWDAVVIWNTLEHCIDPLATLKAAHGMLAPKGVLLVSVPAKRTQELERTYAGAHLSEFTPDSMELCATMAGFQLSWFRMRQARHCRQADGRWTKS